MITATTGQRVNVEDESYYKVWGCCSGKWLRSSQSLAKKTKNSSYFPKIMSTICVMLNFQVGKKKKFSLRDAQKEKDAKRTTDEK